MSKICLRKAIDRGIRKVSWWWIPLCVLSCVLIFTQDWIPEYMVSQFDEWEQFEPYRVEIDILEKALQINPADVEAVAHFRSRLEQITTPQMISVIFSFILKAAILLSSIAVVACFLYALMIIFAKASVAQKDDRQLARDAKRSIPAGFGYLVLSIIKALSLVIFIPGIYFYIRLMFTGIIVTENSANPFKAIGESWAMTRGEFGKMLLLFIFELGLNLFALVTIIGVIPVPPMRYTIRTSVYRQLKGLDCE